MSQAKEAHICVSEAEPQTEVHEQDTVSGPSTSLLSRGKPAHGVSSALLWKASWRTSMRG